MGTKFTEISENHATFIQNQHMFFVATAASDGRVNLSPKGMDTLRVLGPNQVVWLNVTGSGNETAAHLRELNRITLMFCEFEGDPKILRLYGHAQVYHPNDPEWNDLLALFPTVPGARQAIDVNVEIVQTSCGKGVPYYTYVGPRDHLNEWAERKGSDGIRKYWEQKNRVSLDGKETGILDEPGN